MVVEAKRSAAIHQRNGIALFWRVTFRRAAVRRSLARRARGVAGRGPLSAVRVFFGKLLALLIGAVRRATRLATAMEARGFGSRPCRTTAREERVRRSDWVLLAGSATLGMMAVGLSLALGTWRFLFG